MDPTGVALVTGPIGQQPIGFGERSETGATRHPRPGRRPASV
jgi:hypothetical protein